MDLELAGDTALVAASSSGFGKASAAAFAEEGANVVINGRDADTLDETRAEIAEGAAGEVVATPADLTDPDEIEALVAATVSEFGGLDHLVTNAGGPPSGSFAAMSDEDWDDAHELLVMSAVRLIRASREHLETGDGGTIVSIASHTVKEALSELVLSNAVRMGVVGLEKTLSRELAPDVRVNAVLPGPHETDRMEYLVQNSVDNGEYDSYDESYENWTEDIPVNRMGDPAEFGRMVAYLSSPRASFVNGTTVMVDGGEAHATL